MSAKERESTFLLYPGLQYANHRPNAGSRYHWAYLVSPKSSPDGANKTTRYHVTNKLLPRDETVKPTWKYEQLPLPRVKTAKLLARILIGKVEKSRKEFENSLKRVPIIQDVPPFQTTERIPRLTRSS